MFVIKTHRKLVLIVFLFRTIISLVNMYRLSTSFITTIKGFIGRCVLAFQPSQGFHGLSTKELNAG